MKVFVVGVVLLVAGPVWVQSARAGDVAAAPGAALDVALTKPYAWINGPYVAPVGRSVVPGENAVSAGLMELESATFHASVPALMPSRRGSIAAGYLV